MARRSFVMYESWADMMSALPDAQAIQLLRAICAYQKGDEYEIKDPVLKAYFESNVRPEMDENSRKYAAKVDAMNAVNEKRVANARNVTTSHDNVTTSCDNVTTSHDNGSVDVDVNDDFNDDEDVNDNEHPTGAKEKRSAQARPARHKHGQYGHVLLTDQQLSDLRAKHGETETEAAIRAVDEYCEQSGRSYKNYALAMEKWGYRSANEQSARSGTTRQQPVDANDYLLSIINGEVTPGDNAGSG